MGADTPAIATRPVGCAWPWSDSNQLTPQGKDAGTTIASDESGQVATRQTRIAPAVDVIEDSHGITLYADLPGVPREKLGVRVQDGHLGIEAEAVVPTRPGLRLQHAELRNPLFARAFTLSPDFDVARIDAQLRDGVLKLTIPRREEATPRRIEVSAGQASAEVPCQGRGALDAHAANRSHLIAAA